MLRRIGQPYCLISGDEDFLGDMDFKVAGTKDGITAVQMDIKIDGLPYDILEQALKQAKEGRLHILGEMAKTLETQEEMSRMLQDLAPLSMKSLLAL